MGCSIALSTAHMQRGAYGMKMGVRIVQGKSHTVCIQRPKVTQK
jgi:hypothetical protein